jgi:hypothetical protein
VKSTRAFVTLRAHATGAELGYYPKLSAQLGYQQLTVGIDGKIADKSIGQEHALLLKTESSIHDIGIS